MNELAPPSLSHVEALSDRVQWTKACLASLINEGRAEGWLEGAPIALPARLRAPSAAIEASSGGSPTDARGALMPWLAARLGLAGVELDLLWLLACIELDPAAGRIAQLFGSVACPDLSVLVAQRLVPIERTQLETLDRLGLIELTTDPRVPMQRRAIRINDRVLEIARGELRLDPELEGIASIARRGDGASAPAALVRAFAGSPAPLIVAIGPEGAGRTTTLARVAGHHGYGTLRVITKALAREPGTLERQLRAVIREACLFELVPVFADLDAVAHDHPAAAASGHAIERAIEHAMERFAGPVLATARESRSWDVRPVVTHVIEVPESEARAAVWKAALAGASDAVLAGAAERYQLRPGSIVAAARNASADAGGDLALVTAASIHAGVRARVGDELGALATRVDWRQTWDDLVLPADPFEQIIELVARVRRRSTVLETWGFGAKVGKGHGVTALFSGPPGTGKTMVAGLVASELGLDLYQVDLSKIVSKYIGETEKNLATLFDAAETGHAILLFDEADALFAKRSEVKSSNDRYANLEVNYLLQRLESFTGVAMLTTNHETAIDDAFRRRLALHVRFPMPEEAQRAHLWRAMLPAAAPVARDVDPARLAREFQMSGGYIKNAVLRAAYRAAEQEAAIGMGHLWSAARAEYEAMGKVTYQLAA